MSSPSWDVSVPDTTPSLPSWVYITARTGYLLTSWQTLQVETVTAKAVSTNATKIVSETASLQPTTVDPTAEAIPLIATAASPTNDDRTMSPGAIAGLVIGSALAGVVVFCLAWRWFVCWKRRRKQKENRDPGAGHTFDPWLLLRGSGKRHMEGATFDKPQAHAGSIPQGPAPDDKMVVTQGRTGEVGRRLPSIQRQGDIVPWYAPGRELQPHPQYSGETRLTVPSPSLPHPAPSESQCGTEADPVSPMSPNSTNPTADSFIPRNRNTNGSLDGNATTRQTRHMHSLPESLELDGREIFTIAENANTDVYDSVTRATGLSPPPLLRASPPVDDFRQPQLTYTPWGDEHLKSAAANHRHHSPYRAVHFALHHPGSQEQRCSPSPMNSPEDQRMDSPGHRATLRPTPREVENGVHVGSWFDLSPVD
ncbi:hypothetical protein PspLS_08534 [Pyricularia sp. CBS 133598]|nr:hypothetical protein PspLS_08534 [Pyricularia sp. CBS 133598]